MEEEKPELKIPKVEYLRRRPTKSVGLEGFNQKGRNYYTGIVKQLPEQEEIKLIFKKEETHRGRLIIDAKAKKYNIFISPGDVDVLIHELTEVERIKKFGREKNKLDKELDHHTALLAQRQALINFAGPNSYMEDVIYSPDGLIATEAKIKAHLIKGIKSTGGRPLPQWWYTERKGKC